MKAINMKYKISPILIGVSAKPGIFHPDLSRGKAVT